MKFASYFREGRACWGQVEGDFVRDSGTALRDRYPTLRDALAAPSLPPLAEENSEMIPLAEVTLRAPIPDARRIFCVGLNYAAHREETFNKPSDHPTIFVRFASSIVGPDCNLICPDASSQFDYEGELAVVIGRAGRHIPESDALEYVAGYSCFNDGSVRDYQRHTTQFTPGKNFEESGSFGPWIVTPDEIPDPAKLELTTRLNGQTVQNSTTDLMLFPVTNLIHFLSIFTALQPGDVIATGTPSGVGSRRDPPLWMKPGDRVEVEISGVGLLANGIAAESSAS